MKKIKNWFYALKINHRAFLMLSKKFPYFMLVTIIKTIWDSTPHSFPYRQQNIPS